MVAVRTLIYRVGHKNRVILANASSMVGSSVVTAGLGFIYWWLAARLFPPAAVGLASAAVSAMTLLGTIGMMGLGTLLIGELPRQPGKEGSLITTAILVSGVAGIIFGALFALAAPLISPELSPLAGNFGNIVLFAFGVCLTALTLVLDQALIGLLRGGLQLWRNAIFAAAKLGVLAVAGFLLSEKLGLTIYTTWTLGNIISLAALVGFILYKRRNLAGEAGLAEKSSPLTPTISPRIGEGAKVLQKIKLSPSAPDFRLLRGLGKAALGHHMLNLALLAPGMTLPVLVTAMLSATTNAHFYVAWMVTHIVFVGPMALTTVLYAVGAKDPNALAQKMRFTLGLALMIGLAANVFLMLFADQILRLFGASYADEAAWTLRILGLGVFAINIKDHFVVINRIYGRLKRASLPVALGGALELGLAAVGAYFGGLSGLALGWMIANYLEAIYMAPTVYRAATYKVEEGHGQKLPAKADNFK